MTGQQFEMVAKTMQGLEEVLADELRALGAERVMTGRRMVSFVGDLEMLYKANLCCRTALRILKPLCKFEAGDPDALYEQAKEYDWGSILTVDKTFAIDSVVYSDEFRHSRYVTYRIKDAIVDWFKDRLGPDKRPGVRLEDADVIVNVHISGREVTLSLDSSGDSLHKRGYRVAQTEAPINEVLAAGIILRSGWRGDTTLLDPMCGSGTFLVEAALIAANINPGVFRKNYAFEQWPDFDAELFERLYNDDSAEREVTCRIIGADISQRAVDVAKANLKSAGVARYVTVKCKPLSQWTEAPEAPEGGGVIITNPPYGERISAPDMEGLYRLIGSQLKRLFAGWHAWVIGYREEYFDCIGLSASAKIPMYNGSLECQLREYVMFDGTFSDFRKQGGRLRELPAESAERPARSERAERRDDRRGRSDRRDGRRDNRRDDRRDDRRDRRDDRRDDRDRRRFDHQVPVDADPENPLARRRNPHTLKSLAGKRPTLPPAEGPIMRPRGWRKKS